MSEAVNGSLFVDAAFFQGGAERSLYTAGIHGFPGFGR